MWESQPNPSTAERFVEEITVGCVDAAGRSAVLVAHFGYDPVDPYAVSITFGHPPESVRWDLARDLLLDGLTEPTGLGDVHVWPSVDVRGNPVLMLEFCSPDGELLVRVPTRRLHRFLMRSTTLVGRGAESARLDLDDAIAQLLA